MHFHSYTSRLDPPPGKIFWIRACQARKKGVSYKGNCRNGISPWMILRFSHSHDRLLVMTMALITQNPFLGGEGWGLSGVKPILQHRYKYKNQDKAFVIIKNFCLKTRIKICTTLIMHKCKKKNGSVGSILIKTTPFSLHSSGVRRRGWF